MTDGDDCCFDDWAGSWSKRAKRKRTVAGVTGPLLDGLEEAGIAGRSMLDVGAGIGDLSIEAIRRGAAAAHCMELSTRAVEEGRALAADRGVSERVTFETANGAEADLPAADVVVLNRVFCCYPDIDGLVANSLGAARSVYAFSMPVSSGFIGFFNRFETALSNVGYRLREGTYHGFRVFVHDVGAIDRRVRDAGFEPVRVQRRRFGWHLAVYRRRESARLG